MNTRFSGTREDPSVRGSISGIGVDNFTPENLIAGVREGIAAELLELLRAGAGGRRARVTAVAGSGKRNPAEPGAARASSNHGSE